MPPKNHLIPRNFEILKLDPKHADAPRDISQWQDTKVWFLQDQMFSHPKGIVQMKIHTSDNGFGFFPEALVFAHLWKAVLKDLQHEYMYTASRVDMLFGIEINHDDVQFFWKGYNDTLFAFVYESLQFIVELKDYDYELLHEVFDQAKDHLTDEWTALEHAQPYKLAHEMLQNILVNNGTRKQDLLQLLETYTFDDFHDELQTWLVTGSQTWFVHGNFDKYQAMEIVTNSRDLLNLKEFATDQLAKVKPLELKEGEAIHLEEQLNDKNGHYECLLTYY